MIKKNSVSRKKLHKYDKKHTSNTTTKQTIKKSYSKLCNLSKITNKTVLLNNTNTNNNNNTNTNTNTNTNNNNNNTNTNNNNNNNNNTNISRTSLIVRKIYLEYPILTPCILEWVNIANSSSIINGVSVYESRLKMGEKLADTIIWNNSTMSIKDIDYISPITEYSRPVAIMVAEKLKKVYREIIIMDPEIKKNNKHKCLMIDYLIKDKNLLIITDSIVRGNTLTYIISELRKNGANKIIVAFSTPPIKNINKYGIDIQYPGLLIYNGKTDEEIAYAIGADLVIYQKIEDLKKSISDINPDINNFEMSVFDN